MKILFISDIHGIIDNLEIIDKKIKDLNIDKLICLGDIYYTGPSYNSNHKVNSIEVLNFLIKHKDKLICLRGNCDSDVDIKVSDFPICDSLSLINVDNINLYLTHGNKYNIDNNKIENGVLIYGHYHIPYIKNKDNVIYICVGSISLPKENNPTYALYENKKITIYDIYDNIIDSIDLNI